MSVHPTALIGPDATIGAEVEIGPFTVCDATVRIADRVVVGAHCVIGGRPKIRGFTGPTGRVEVGERSFVAEQVAIDSPRGPVTHLGADCFVMPHCYVGHDCWIEDEVTLTAGTQLGGHVRIGRGSTIGLGTVVHQRSVIGAWVRVGMGSVVSRDLPPFCLAYGNPARLVGPSRAAIERLGIREIDLGAAIREYLMFGRWPIESGREEIAWFEAGRTRGMVKAR